jgi:hypothetical protein
MCSKAGGFPRQASAANAVSAALADRVGGRGRHIHQVERLPSACTLPTRTRWWVLGWPTACRRRTSLDGRGGRRPAQVLGGSRHRARFVWRSGAPGNSCGRPFRDLASVRTRHGLWRRASRALRCREWSRACTALCLATGARATGSHPSFEKTCGRLSVCAYECRRFLREVGLSGRS